MNNKLRAKYKTNFTNNDLDDMIKEEAGIIVPLSLLSTGTTKNQKVDLWDMIVRMKKPVRKLINRVHGGGF